ncbi:MAG: arginine N-succinyltransferase [Gammaproteobacteria bacterium]|nr:arginine N-succinyltransferase [Gammaproteobacteria bacterium]
MLIVRPAALTDLDALERLAREAGPGMTNLPPDRGTLRERLVGSVAALSEPISSPGEESYLLVLEDLDPGTVVGCCAIFGAVGLTRPFYSFRLSKLPHTSRELGRFESVEVLQLVDEYAGASELAMLFLRQSHRRDGNGGFLSRSRFLFMGSFPERFAPRVMAEMRGVSDEAGRSILWESLGRHFFDMDFVSADRLSAEGHYQFIADLMPKFPVYVRLLPKAAQAAIGVPHPHTAPALALLNREGFRYEGCVDVFDGGPTVHCPMTQIRTIQDRALAPVGAISEVCTGPPHLIAKSQSDAAGQLSFRACRGALSVGRDGTAQVDREVAIALGLSIGDELSFVPDSRRTQSEA